MTSSLLLLLLLLTLQTQANYADDCLDEYAERLGVTALPNSASNQYKQLYCQYTKLDTSNGPIEIYGQTQLSSLQLYRARKILEFFLSDYGGTNKTTVRNKMGQNKSKLDMPNGAHGQPGSGQSLQGQELYYSETPVEGDKWFMNNNMNHRDAAFEEILHLVHDNGIGIDGSGSFNGAMPAYQNQIRAATNNAQPTWLIPSGKGIWAENENEWVLELQEENSLTQEYLASVIDVYYGLWGNYGEGMWGIYEPSTREEIQSIDPMGYALLPQFFSPWLTWMVMLSPTLDQDFSMIFNSNKGYTWKSQYFLHATLLGMQSVNLTGNNENNCLGPNAGTNTLNGKGGIDVAIFQGSCLDYSILCNDGNCNVIDSTPNRDGTTHTVNMDILTFRDGDYDISSNYCTVGFSSLSSHCWSLIDSFNEPTPSPIAPPSPEEPTCIEASNKKECKKIEGCSWKSGSCSTALSTSECNDYNGTKQKCKRNGCKWQKTAKKCIGYWG